MIKKLIEKLYWKYCSENLSGELIKLEDLDKTLEHVASVPGYRDFLRTLARSDKERYFHATTEAERDLIKGSYQRVVYLYRQLKEKKIEKESKKPTYKIGGRYA